MRTSAPRVPITCMIVNMATGKVININHVPDELSDSNSANFGETSVQGRSAPILGYEGSGPRSVTFSVQLHDDYCEGDINNTVQALKALTYPLYDAYIKPPKSYVRLGNTLKMVGVCNDVSVSWHKPIREGKYISCEVALSFRAVTDIPLSANDVEWGEG